jgi:hypothetical protein
MPDDDESRSRLDMSADAVLARLIEELKLDAEVARRPPLVAVPDAVVEWPIFDPAPDPPGFRYDDEPRRPAAAPADTEAARKVPPDDEQR